MMLRLLSATLALSAATALDNGVGRTPMMGWSSWYATPGGSNVTSAFVRATAQVMLSSGLAAKGYSLVAVDEGWLQGRYPNGTIYEDLSKFPEGMAGLGAWVTGQGFRYGLYTCRGTCQCSTEWYQGPGSHGYEQADVDWIVAAGARYLKVDSCCGSQDHATAFSDYAKFRDALNATGSHVYYDLCGWNYWYAPPDPSVNYTGGASLGNAWRISGDGGSWPAITAAINTVATLGNYSGPGGWNDADNILGPHCGVGGVTEVQALSQMILWSIFPSQLILGEDLTQASDNYLQNIAGNTELIAVNQDTPYAGSGARIQGGDLTFPCDGGALPPQALYAVHAVACNASDPMQRWAFNTTDGTLRLATAPATAPAVLTFQDCNTADGTLTYLFPPGVDGSGCGGGNQLWSHDAATGRIVNSYSGKCLDEYMWTTPRVDLWTCVDGATNEQWAMNTSVNPAGLPGVMFVNQDSGYCLAATGADTTSCTNIWARPLSDGGVALGFLNNGNDATTVTCDAACFAAAGITPATAPNGVAVRDMIAHTDNGVLLPPFQVAVNVTGGGGGAALRLKRL